MNTKRKVAFRTISMVVTAFVAVTVAAGPAEAAGSRAGGSPTVSTMGDTCWGK